MDNYRTSSLFHFTNQKNNIKNILKEGLKANFAKETNLDGFVIGIPMISTCDIPITRTKTIQRYGSYALGFTKEWGMKNGFNPIHYVQGEIFEIALERLNRINQITLKKFEEKSINKSSSDINHIDYKTNIQYEFSELYDIYNFTNISRAFTKPYYGKTKEGKEIVNYDENEWRYIIPLQTPNNWLWGDDNYKTWRGDVKKTKPKSVFEPLKFKVNDITFILLQFENQIPDLVNYISNLNTLAGDDISQEDKNILMTKIFSFDRIKKDF